MTRLTLAALVISLFACAALSAASPAGTARQPQDPTDPLSIIDNSSYIDANNIKMMVTNHGSWAYDITHQGPGLWYPKGTDKTSVYASGLWIGAKIYDEIHITAGSFIQEYTPGPVIGDCEWPDISAPEHKVYKIYEGMDTTLYDYQNWPRHLGAPVDEGGRPLLKGDQTLWCVYNDADPDVHVADEGSANNDPMGLEVQQTAFALDRPGALGNTIFMEFKIINRCDYIMESTYVSIWCDPDIGGGGDDYAGCHPIRNLGYAYNADNDDNVYGVNPPCVGYDWLKPTVDVNGQKRYMTAFSMYINSTDPRSSLESYNYMRGLDLYGHSVIDPTTGEVTKYMLSGDPVTGTGWLDSDPADRRFMMTSGPFTMAPGDSQEIALAIVVGQGSDRIESVEIMKSYDAQAQYWYRFGDGRPVFPSFEITAGETEICLAWTNPDDPDFVETIIRYSTETYPEGPAMGLPVPNGNQGRFPGLPGAAGSFVHRDLSPGATYYYVGFAADRTGNYRAMSFGEATPGGSGSSAGAGQPTSASGLSLRACPNPARGTVHLSCSVPTRLPASLTIYNTVGQVVRTVDLGAQAPETLTATWDGRNDDGRDLPAGIYFARLESGAQTRTIKLTLLK